MKKQKEAGLAQHLAVLVGRKKFSVAEVAQRMDVEPRRVRQAIDSLRARGERVVSLGEGWFTVKPTRAASAVKR